MIFFIKNRTGAPNNSGGYASTVNGVTCNPFVKIDIILIMLIRIERRINISIYFKSFEPRYIKQL
jgi:hypothetical protein